MSIEKVKRCRENGIKAARTFGAEHALLPQSSREEYLDKAAFYFSENASCLSELTEEDREVCQREFEQAFNSNKEPAK